MPVDDNSETTEDEVLSSPANSGTTSPGPEAFEPSSASPQGATPVTEVAPSPEGVRAGEEDPPDDDLPVFDERWREDFEGLAYIGRLTREFPYLGHKFVIRTLNIEEILEVGLLAKSYQGSLAESKAYQAALVAACVVSVDGVPPPMPITTSPEDTMILNRFRWVRQNWFAPVLDKVYGEYLRLEYDVERVMQALGEASS